MQSAEERVAVRYLLDRLKHADIYVVPRPQGDGYNVVMGLDGAYIPESHDQTNAVVAAHRSKVRLAYEVLAREFGCA